MSNTQYLCSAAALKKKTVSSREQSLEGEISKGTMPALPRRCSICQSSRRDHYQASFQKNTTQAKAEPSIWPTT